MFHNPNELYHHPQCNFTRICVTKDSLRSPCNCEELIEKDRADLAAAASSKPVKANNPVSHPSHYTSHPSGVECIQITRHYNFNIGNAIKYLWRNGLKDEDAQIQDLEKAIWYIQDYIKTLKETNDK